MAIHLLLAGASGLVGSAVLEYALAHPDVARVNVLVRKPLPVQHPKLEPWLADGPDLLSGLHSASADAVICCLGTTIRTVGGDKDKFMHVDKDLPLGLGRWAKQQGARSFAVVSAIGADVNSAVFYSRVKGEMEAGLEAIGLPALHIFQPSILTGPRKEVRIGERIGIGAMKMLAPLMIGSMARYKPMPSTVLARALVHATLEQVGPGAVQRHTYASIVDLAAR